MGEASANRAMLPWMAAALLTYLILAVAGVLIALTLSDWRDPELLLALGLLPAVGALLALPLYGMPVVWLLQVLGLENLVTITVAGALPGLIALAVVDPLVSLVIASCGAVTAVLFFVGLQRLRDRRRASRRLTRRAPWIRLVFLLTLSVPVLSATLAIPVRVESHGQLARVPLGKPFAFLTQDFSMRDPPLPRALSFGLPQEHPTRIRPQALIVDAALVTLGLWLGSALLQRVLYRQR